jgi:hypothetical protein
VLLLLLLLLILLAAVAAAATVMFCTGVELGLTLKEKKKKD